MDPSVLEAYRCELLIREIPYRADLGDRGSVADLFLPHGVFSMPGLELVGRDAIRDWFVATGSPTRPLVRHVCTNTTVRFRDPTHAEASTYLTLFRDPTAPAVPAPLRGVQAVGVYWDELEKVDEEWFFATHRYEPTFTAERPAP